MPGFRDIDETSERVRAITVPLIPFEWSQERGEVFARFGQAIAMAQLLEAELRVTISLLEHQPVAPSPELRIKQRTLGRLAKLLKEMTIDDVKDTKAFHDELERIVDERNSLAHELFRTRMFAETPNSNVDDLLSDDGRQRLVERLGRATGDFAYTAVILSDLNKALSE
jgi:hypothetical protein